MTDLITEPVPHDQHVQAWKFIQVLTKGGRLAVGKELWKRMFDTTPKHGYGTTVDYPGSLTGITVVCSEFLGPYDMLALDEFWFNPPAVKAEPLPEPEGGWKSLGQFLHAVHARATP